MTALNHAISYKNIDIVALIRKKTNWQEENASLSLNQAIGKPSHYKPDRNMFDVPADKSVPII